MNVNGDTASVLRRQRAVFSCVSGRVSVKRDQTEVTADAGGLCEESQH